MPSPDDGEWSTPELERYLAEFEARVLTFCYFMVGSIEVASTLTRDTFRRARRDHLTYGELPSRSVLYGIATRACLAAIEQDGPAPAPDGRCSEDHQSIHHP